MRTLLAVCLVIVVSTFAVSALSDYEFDAPGYTFEQYVDDFQKSYTPQEYKIHRVLFNHGLKRVIAHNQDKTRSYRMAVNKFTDMSPTERARFLGYSQRHTKEQIFGARKMAEPWHGDLNAIPTSVDWRNANPPIITPVKDQGGCGSCWAHAATEEVESSLANNTGQLINLSRQNMLECTPNPNDCGGTGGCEGATAELGLAYVQSTGIASEADYPYTGEDGQCDETIKKTAKISSFVKLAENNYTAVVTAVAYVGPLAITVAAGDWFGYSSGVYDGCTYDDIDLDHGVQLVGYGTDSEDYWLVRNSWGEDWGESGYIRLLKHSDGSSKWCGIDHEPSDGTGCTGGPTQVTACGSCGIWYDTCYAVGGAPF
jgi:cathepsin L